MKNVLENQLRQCILMSFDEFKDLVEELTNGLATAHDKFEIYISETSKAIKSKTYWDKEMVDTLSEYFGVTVTSFHSDNFTPSGVWICFKE